MTAELIRGGIGVVYTAQVPRLKRQVAIKLLPPDLTKEDTAKQRFLQLARLERFWVIARTSSFQFRHKGHDLRKVGEALVTRLRRFREHGVHVLGSFIFGLPSDQAGTFDYTVALAKRSGIDFAQFLTLTPMPGTIDFERWERDLPDDAPTVSGIPMSRYWLMTKAERPRLFTAHPSMSAEEIRRRTQQVWSEFYEVREAWKRSAEVSGLRNRLTFVLMSKLYRQMYGGTGLAADSARESRATGWARLLAKPVQQLFAATPMPDLEVPQIHDEEGVHPMASRS